MGRRWIALCALLSACGIGESGSVQPARSEVYAGASSQIIALPDGTVILEEGSRLLMIDPLRPELDAIVVGPAENVGDLRAAVRASDSAFLVLTSEGSFVFRDAAWVPSQLAASLDGPIVAATMVPTATSRETGDLWVSTETSLYRIVENTAPGTPDEEAFLAERLRLDEDLSEAQLATALRPEGPSLWVLLPDRILEVWRDRTGVTRTAGLGLEQRPSEIGGDATPTGWLVIDGQLHSIGAARQLVSHGIEVERMLTSSDSAEAWFWGTDGRLWLSAEDRLWLVEETTVAADATVALGPDGALYVAGETVERLAPRRTVGIDGPEDGAFIGAPTPFRVEAEGTPTIEVVAGGVGIEAVEGDYTVDPALLGEGQFEIVFRVRYDDGTLPTELSRSFEVITEASWTEHIEPLYQTHCSACHGAAGPAHRRLDAIDGWATGMLSGRAVIDVIKENVIEGRMPLNRPPLSLREIALIEAWEASGFPE